MCCMFNADSDISRKMSYLQLSFVVFKYFSDFRIKFSDCYTFFIECKYGKNFSKVVVQCTL